MENVGVDDTPTQVTPIVLGQPLTNTVLVIDEDSTTRLMLEHHLRQRGHRVILAEDGVHGVSLFEDHGADIVLVDDTMSRMDGFETARRIKALAGSALVSVVFLTSLDNPELMLRCIEAGGDDYIGKPVNPHILAAKLGLVERAHARQAEFLQLLNHIQHDQEIAENVYTRAIAAGNVATDVIRVMTRPASIFSGDMFITARQPTGGVNVLLGDLTGHGLSATIGALPASETFRAMTVNGFSILEIANELNVKLNALLPTGMFMCACLLSFDRTLQSVQVWNGGMPEVLFLSQTSGTIERRMPSVHLPLGVSVTLQDEEPPEFVSIQPGDRIFLYSDGLIEARNDAGEMFGEARLEQTLQRGDDSDQAFFRVQRLLAAFCDQRTLEDDSTLVEIPCVPTLVDSSTIAQRPPRVTRRIRGSGAWHWMLELKAQSLKSVDPLPIALGQLQELRNLSPHRKALYIVLFELYNNALEHGVLRLPSGLKASEQGVARYYEQRRQHLAVLDSGFVCIQFAYQPGQGQGDGQLVIVVEDSGNGFDYQKALLAVESEAIHSNRGIARVKRLCQSLCYDGCGNRVTAAYSL